MIGANQDKGSWFKVQGKNAKRFHFVLSGEKNSLCNIHESHFDPNIKFNDNSKKCMSCVIVLNTYNDLNNRPTKPEPIADNYRTNTHENYEFIWDHSSQYY